MVIERQIIAGHSNRDAAMRTHIAANTKLILTPRRNAMLAGCDNQIEVLVRIQASDAPEVDVKQRPPYGIALVIDHSGSMAGRPLHEAKRCADFVVDRLRADDVVSLVKFDNRVTVLQPVAAKGSGHALRAAIQSIDEGGNTNLHGGWREGADSMAGFDSTSLRRVILLSDGCANEGITEPSEIAAQCKELADLGVTTSTYGLGDHFNEELMVAMADSGQGNHYYGDTAEDLLEPFQQEFDLLANLAIRGISLRAAVPAGGQVRMLNDYVGSQADGWHLPDLPWGAEAWAILRIRLPKPVVPPEGQELSFLRVEVSGLNLDGESVNLEPANLTLRSVGSAALSQVAENELVARRLSELEAAGFLRLAREAARNNDWPRVDRILADAERQFTGNDWLASVLEAIRTVAKSRSRERFMKEALYSSSNFSNRLSEKEEDMVLMERSKPSYLRRKAAQGKAAFADNKELTTLRDAVISCTQCEGLSPAIYPFGKALGLQYVSPVVPLNILFVAESPPAEGFFYDEHDGTPARFRRRLFDLINLADLGPVDSIASFNRRGYFLADAINCRWDKSVKPTGQLSAIKRNCSRHLRSHITALRPKAIVLMGNIASDVFDHCGFGEDSGGNGLGGATHKIVRIPFITTAPVPTAMIVGQLRLLR